MREPNDDVEPNPAAMIAAERDDLHDQLDSLRWWLIGLTVIVGVLLMGGDRD